MGKIVKARMWHSDYEELRINFHINSLPWKHKHTHDYWEIQIMLSGEAQNIINEEKQVLSQGEVQILRPDDLHYLTDIDCKRYACLNLEIKKSMFTNLCKLIYPNCLECLLSYENRVPSFFLPEAAMSKIKEWMHCAQREIDIIDENRQFFLTRIFLESLNFFITHKCMTQHEEGYSFSDKLIEIMRKPDNIDLKLWEICEKFPCSVEYAIRTFAQEGKETPNKEFRKIKLAYACGLLRTTEYKIVAISEMVGFSSLWHFNKIFIEYYGESPAAYRKKYFRR